MKNEKLIDIKKLLPRIQENVSLAKYTTFKIGGKARYFFTANNKKDIIRAVKAARRLKLPFFILGGGSNILVSDKGFDGLVINFQFSIFNFQNTKLTAGAGSLLGKLVNAAAEKGLEGLEWAAGIYGTIGGAIRGNAGAFGRSMKDVVAQVEVFDIAGSRIKNFLSKDCCFGYRDSFFKKKNNFIILSALLQLNQGNKKEIEQKMESFLKQKKKTQPLNFPSAGSIFKNQKGPYGEELEAPTKIKNQKLFKQYPALEKFCQQGVIPAGFLIEKCGLKGKKVGNAQISEKHANFIVNLGKARAQDVLQLIDLIKIKVKEKFKIDLEEEIVIL